MPSFGENVTKNAADMMARLRADAAKGGLNARSAYTDLSWLQGAIPEPDFQRFKTEIDQTAANFNIAEQRRREGAVPDIPPVGLPPTTPPATGPGTPPVADVNVSPIIEDDPASAAAATMSPEPGPRFKVVAPPTSSDQPGSSVTGTGGYTGDDPLKTALLNVIVGDPAGGEPKYDLDGVGEPAERTDLDEPAPELTDHDFDLRDEWKPIPPTLHDGTVFPLEDLADNELLQELYRQATEPDIQWETQFGYDSARHNEQIQDHAGLYEQGILLFGGLADNDIRKAVIDAFVNIGGLPRGVLYTPEVLGKYIDSILLPEARKRYGMQSIVFPVIDYDETGEGVVGAEKAASGRFPGLENTEIFTEIHNQLESFGFDTQLDTNDPADQQVLANLGEQFAAFVEGTRLLPELVSEGLGTAAYLGDWDRGLAALSDAEWQESGDLDGDPPPLVYDIEDVDLDAITQEGLHNALLAGDLVPYLESANVNLDRITGSDLSNILRDKLGREGDLPALLSGDVDLSGVSGADLVAQMRAEPERYLPGLTSADVLLGDIDPEELRLHLLAGNLVPYLESQDVDMSLISGSDLSNMLRDKLGREGDLPGLVSGDVDLSGISGADLLEFMRAEPDLFLPSLTPEDVQYAPGFGPDLVQNVLDQMDPITVEDARQQLFAAGFQGSLNDVIQDYIEQIGPENVLAGVNTMLPSGENVFQAGLNELITGYIDKVGLEDILEPGLVDDLPALIKELTRGIVTTDSILQGGTGISGKPLSFSELLTEQVEGIISGLPQVTLADIGLDEQFEADIQRIKKDVFDIGLDPLLVDHLVDIQKRVGGEGGIDEILRGLAEIGLPDVSGLETSAGNIRSDLLRVQNLLRPTASIMTQAAKLPDTGTMLSNLEAIERLSFPQLGPAATDAERIVEALGSREIGSFGATAEQIGGAVSPAERIVAALGGFNVPDLNPFISGTGQLIGPEGQLAQLREGISGVSDVVGDNVELLNLLTALFGGELPDAETLQEVLDMLGLPQLAGRLDEVFGPTGFGDITRRQDKLYDALLPGTFGDSPFATPEGVEKAIADAPFLTGEELRGVLGDEDVLAGLREGLGGFGVPGVQTGLDALAERVGTLRGELFPGDRAAFATPDDITDAIGGLDFLTVADLRDLFVEGGPLEDVVRQGAPFDQEKFITSLTDRGLLGVGGISAAELLTELEEGGYVGRGGGTGVTPGLTVDDIISALDERGYAGRGDGDMPGAFERYESGAELANLRDVLEARIKPEPRYTPAGGRLTQAEELRQDPVTAALLQDLSRRRDEEQRELVNALQNYGVLRGGDTERQLGELSADYTGAEMGVLSDAAQRVDTRTQQAIGQALDLAGVGERRELGLTDLFGRGRDTGEGWTGKTLAGEQAELDRMAAGIAAMHEEIDIPRDAKIIIGNRLMGDAGFTDTEYQALVEILANDEDDPEGFWTGLRNDMKDAGRWTIDKIGDVAGGVGDLFGWLFGGLKDVF